MIRLRIDARGERCPLPVIRLAEAVRDHLQPASSSAGAAAPPDTLEVTVLATDPAARHDIPAWCRMRGHARPREENRGDHTAYVVVVRAGQSENASGS